MESQGGGICDWGRSRGGFQLGPGVVVRPAARADGCHVSVCGFTLDHHGERHSPKNGLKAAMMIA